jgi:hypothetical protein
MGTWCIVIGQARLHARSQIELRSAMHTAPVVANCTLRMRLAYPLVQGCDRLLSLSCAIALVFFFFFFAFVGTPHHHLSGLSHPEHRHALYARLAMAHAVAGYD